MALKHLGWITNTTIEHCTENYKRDGALSAQRARELVTTQKTPPDSGPRYLHMAISKAIS